MPLPSIDTQFPDSSMKHLNLKRSTIQLIESFRYRRSWLPRNSYPGMQLERKTIARRFRGIWGDFYFLGSKYCRERELASLQYRKHLVELAEQGEREHKQHLARLAVTGD